LAAWFFPLFCGRSGNARGTNQVKLHPNFMYPEVVEDGSGVGAWAILATLIKLPRVHVVGTAVWNNAGLSKQQECNRVL